MAANPGFPLSLDVRGYPVLVLGGDEEAAEKTRRLLEAGAKVTVEIHGRQVPAEVVRMPFYISKELKNAKA